MTDVCDREREDLQYRRDVAISAGVGFELSKTLAATATVFRAPAYFAQFPEKVERPLPNPTSAHEVEAMHPKAESKPEFPRRSIGMGKAHNRGRLPDGQTGRIERPYERAANGASLHRA